QALLQALLVEFMLVRSKAQALVPTVGDPLTGTFRAKAGQIALKRLQGLLPEGLDLLARHNSSRRKQRPPHLNRTAAAALPIPGFPSAVPSFLRRALAGLLTAH